MYRISENRLTSFNPFQIKSSNFVPMALKEASKTPYPSTHKGVTLLYIEIWLGIRKGPWLRERTGIPLFPHRWELAVKEFHGQS